MMKKINYLLLLILSIAGFTSCEKDKIEEKPGAFANGIYVINEGNWGQGNASVSFVNKDLDKVENNIYESTNDVALGDLAQSIGFSGENAYIVVSSSQKIEVVDRNSMEHIATISSGLNNPRYFLSTDSNTALVSCWGDAIDSSDDYLAIVDINSNIVTGEIPVALGPEKMTKNDDYLFVAHQGARGTNNKISVYDLVLKDVVQEIEVGYRPNSMVIHDNYLWVMCSGEIEYDPDTYEIIYETAGQLYKIDINDNFNIVQTFDFETTQHPALLTLDNNNLYYYVNGTSYGSGDIYKMNINDTNLPASNFFDSFTPYNMEAYDGKLYLTDAKYFEQEGEIVVFDANNGTEIARQTVGIIPGDIGFNFE